MDNLTAIAELAAVPGPVHLAIGVFDGVHRGHQKVIQRALNGARRDGGSAVVVTFDPHPVEVLRPAAAPPWLTPLVHQKQVLDRAGVDHLLAVPFDRAFAEVEAEAFVKELSVACRPLKRICVGYSWRFGKDRKGDIHVLADLGQRFNFEFTAIPEVEVRGETVSSTLIRKAVADGDLDRAEAFLGRRFALFGQVVKGDGRGRTLGFPTANIAVVNGCLPPNGVYAVRCLIRGQHVPGIANLGVRPTVDHGRQSPVFEVHLFDWEQDLYGDAIEVSFHKRIRAEKQFANLDELKLQVADDIVQAKGMGAC